MYKANETSKERELVLFDENNEELVLYNESLYLSSKNMLEASMLRALKDKNYSGEKANKIFENFKTNCKRKWLVDGYEGTFRMPWYHSSKEPKGMKLCVKLCKTI